MPSARCLTLVLFCILLSTSSLIEMWLLILLNIYFLSFVLMKSYPTSPHYEWIIFPVFELESTFEFRLLLSSSCFGVFSFSCGFMQLLILPKLFVFSWIISFSFFLNGAIPLSLTSLFTFSFLAIFFDIF